MSLWKWFVVIVVGGLQVHALGQTELERRASCLENYALAERELATRIIELESRKNPGYLAMGGGAAGWAYCVFRSRSIPGAVACTGIFGLVGASGYSWNQELDELIKKGQDAATVMSIYSAIKDSRDDSEEVTEFIRDLQINSAHEMFAKQNVIQAMEAGSLCDERGLPNKSYLNFLEAVRPGDR